MDSDIDLVTIARKMHFQIFLLSSSFNFRIKKNMVRFTWYVCMNKTI